MFVCFGFAPAAFAGAPGAGRDTVHFDQGVNLPGFIAAAAALEAEIPAAGRLPGAALRGPARAAEIVAEFQTMGRHEGVRVDDNTALVSLETQLTAGGAPDFVQLEVKYQEIPKDKEALAVDPGALGITVSLPLKHYSSIFEAEKFFMTAWELDGKKVSAYASHDGRTKFVQITQTTGDASGGRRTIEVLKLTVAGKEISMGQLEKFKPESDAPYFSEYIVMPTKEAHGLALLNPALAGRISAPALIKYVAAAPTEERMAEVLKAQ